MNASVGRNSSDASSTYTLDEQRKIADCFTQRPLCEKQVVAKTDEAAQANAKADKQVEQYDELAEYTTHVEANYTELFNSTAVAQRSPKCLWLWHCTKPHISTPHPKLLKRPRA